MHLGYNSPLIWISITIQWSMIQHHTCKVKIIDSINKIWLHVEIPMARICHFFGPSIPLSWHSNSAEKQMMAWSQEKKIKIFTLFLGGGGQSAMWKYVGLKRNDGSTDKHWILLSSLPTCCCSSISSSVSTMKKHACRLKFNCGFLLTDAVI